MEYHGDVDRAVVAGHNPVFSGNGIQGSSGDGGPAASASLFCAAGVALDSTGNLFVGAGFRIRQITPSGTITTVAGGEGGGRELIYPLGVAVDGAGSLFIAESVSRLIRKVSAGGTIATVAGTGAEGPSGDGGPRRQSSIELSCRHRAGRRRQSVPRGF